MPTVQASNPWHVGHFKTHLYFGTSPNMCHDSRSLLGYLFIEITPKVIYGVWTWLLLFHSILIIVRSLMLSEESICLCFLLPNCRLQLCCVAECKFLKPWVQQGRYCKKSAIFIVSTSAIELRVENQSEDFLHHLY